MRGPRVGVVDTDIQSPGIDVLFDMSEDGVKYALNDYLWGDCGIETDIPDRTFLIPASIRAGEIARWTNQQAIVDQTGEDDRIIAGLLARSAGFAEDIPQDVENVIGKQMLAGATLTPYLVAVATEAGYTPDEITEMPQDVTTTTGLDEFWITDDSGDAYITTDDAIDFTFSPNPQEQPQASMFWPLLTGEEENVVQMAQERDVDEGVFKYADVGGIDRPCIIQLGTSADLLEQLGEEVGPARLADELLASGSVSSIRILDHNFETIAYSGNEADVPMDWQQVPLELRGATSAGETMSHQTEWSISPMVSHGVPPPSVILSR